ncbi:hypothetical protein Tco_0433435 [Tanacetum coccineum]
MHTYVSRLKDTEHDTLIATSDIPLDLRPRLPDPNFRMINLPAGDTTIDKVPTNFNQNHVDQLKAHIVKRHDIPEGVLVQSGLSRVWRNPVCDPVLRRSDNTVMSIYDILCMPSLDNVTIREEPHVLGTSILGRVVDRTTSPALVGTVIPRASLEEIVVTRPDPKVVTKANHMAKRKASTRPVISTNAAKKTRSSKKGSGASSSVHAAIGELEQTDDGNLDDDDQRDGPEFAMEGNESLTDVSIGSRASSGAVWGMRRTTRASFCAPHSTDISEITRKQSKKGQARTRESEENKRSQRFKAEARKVKPQSNPEAMPAPDTQPLDADAGSDEIASDGNVDLYYEARVSNTAGDVLERDLLPFVPRPYYIPYPYDKGSGKLYKDPKVCRTALDRFPTPAETRRLRELSSVELSDRMSVLQCQLITHGSMLNARYDYSLRNVERLTKWCAQQTQTIKKQGADLKQQKESTIRANENERDTLSTEKAKIEEELVGTKSQLEHRERQAEEIQGSIASFFQSDFTTLVRRFLKSSDFNRAFAVGFIPDAKENFDRAIAAFPDTTFPLLDKTSSVAQSLRVNTHIRHSTSSSRAFGHTSTPEHLKKKKKSVEKGGPSAA